MSSDGLNSLLDQLAPIRHTKARYLFAAALAISAVALAAIALVLFRPTVTLIFAVMVAAAAALFGRAAGLLSAAIATVAIDFFFVPPAFQLKIDGALLRAAIELGVIAVAAYFLERSVSNRIRRKKKTPLGLHGALDGIVDGQVFGWAMDADNPSSPVLVTIAIDSRPAAQVAAVYYRDDVQKLLGSSGSHGFWADLSGRAPADKEIVVTAHTSSGQVLANSPLKGRLPPRIREDEPAILFMHIPRTAGTAFREAIARNYREHAIAYLYGTPPGFLVQDLNQLPLEQRRELKVVIGHFPYGIHHYLPQETIYVTIVREPAARLLSHYTYLRHTQPELLKEGNRTLTLEELLKKKPHIHFDNTLVRQFGSVDEREFPAGTIDETLYNKALYYLQREYKFIGHQEFAADAYSWLKRQFGWNTPEQLDFVNPSLIRVDDAERANAQEAFEKYNHWDNLLYREILKLFPYSYARENGA